MVDEAVEKKPFSNPRVVEVETYVPVVVKGKPNPLNPSRVPVQSPVAFNVRAFPEICSPVPVRSLNVSPPTVRFVVEAVMKDEYEVDDEYGEVMRLAAVTFPAVSMVVEAVPPTLSQLAERRVDEACPLKSIKDVVALWPAEG